MNKAEMQRIPRILYLEDNLIDQELVARTVAEATTAPASWATMNGSTDAGAIPANVLDSARPKVATCATT